MAVETVLTFGLGLIAAVGIISVFDSYSSGVYDTAEETEARIVQEQVLDGMNSLRPVEGEAYKELSLPDKISNRNYQVVGEGELIVNVDGTEYSANIPVQDSITGSASGDIRLSKTSQGFELSEG